MERLTLRAAVFGALATCCASGASEAAIPVAGSGSAPGAERLYSVDDMLSAEAFGRVSLDPSRRRVVFERFGPYDTAPRFDLGYFNARTTSVLWVADIAGGEARPLLAADEGRGIMAGDWSPSGARLLVYRLRGDVWDAGVVEAATGAVRWLDLFPEQPAFGRTVQWRGEEELVAIHRPGGGLPDQVGSSPASLASARRRQDAAASGRTSAARLGAGRFAEAPLAPSNRLIAIDVATGRSRVLATGRFFDLELSPDGRWVAAMEIGAAPPLDLSRPIAGLERPNDRRLHLVDVAGGGRAHVCETCNVSAGLMRWSDDGARLLVWIWTAPGPGAGRLVALDPAAGSSETFNLGDLSAQVDPAAGASDAVRAAWLGDRPVLRARRPGADRADWWSLGAEAPVNLSRDLPSPPGRLEALSAQEALVLAGGRVWRLSPVHSAMPVSSPGTMLKPFSGLGGFDPPRLRLNTPIAGADMPVVCVDGRLTRALAPACGRAEPDTVREPLAAAAGVAVERTSRNGVERLELRVDGRTRTLAALNTAMADITFARPVPVRHRSPDGTEISSWLYLPPGRLAQNLPVVLIAYPGPPRTPQTEFTAINAETNVQLFAAAGYAVLVASLPRVPDGEPAAGLADQILAVLDAATAQHPELDRDRVALVGHSFGGYTALVAATQTRRFRSIIAAASSSDLAAKWGESTPINRADPLNGPSRRHRVGVAESGFQSGLGGPPWSAPDRYVRNSPLFDADAIETPVLLVHGDQDMIAIGQAEMMFTALWRQNKDVRLLTYWGEGHNLDSPGNIRDLERELLDWLGLTLGPPAPFTGPRAAPPSAEPNSPRPTPG